MQNLHCVYENNKGADQQGISTFGLCCLDGGSCVKPAFCICFIYVYALKQWRRSVALRSNYAADQHLCFHYIDRTVTQNFKPLFIISGCTAKFVSDMVRNHKNRFLMSCGLYPRFQDYPTYVAEQAGLCLI